MAVRCPGLIAITNKDLDPTGTGRRDMHQAIVLRYVCRLLHHGQESNGYATKSVRRTLSNAETKARGPPTEPRGNVSCQTARSQTDHSLPFPPRTSAYVDLPLFRLIDTHLSLLRKI